jgi:tetratricopeptide (TPR) repeat protein
VGQAVVDPAAAAVDPKDTYAVLETYRAAMELAVTRQWPKALTLLQKLAHEQPEMADLWRQISSIAFRAGRYDQALEANKGLAALDEHDTAAHLDAAEALLRLRRLDEARREAMLAIDTGLPEGPAAASAHELMARIALVRRDVEQADAEAALAREADPTDPASSYIEGRVHFEQGRYTDALASFEDAAQSIERSHARRVADLHYFLGETLVHLDRPGDAEASFRQELETFPQNTRAWT